MVIEILITKQVVSWVLADKMMLDLIQQHKDMNLKKKKQVKFVGEIPDDGPEVVAYPTDQRLSVKARKANTVKKKSGRRSRWWSRPSTTVVKTFRG